MNWLQKILESPEFWAALVSGGALGGVFGFLTARYQVRAERERLREELENRFGSAQRSVYRHFLLHLERYGEPRPGSKEEAGELGLKESEEVAWDRRYQWERGKMLVVSGRRILDLVMANDFSQESVAKDAKLREHLAKVMHMELFPRLYTDEEKAALTNESPGGQDASGGAA